MSSIYSNKNLAVPVEPSALKLFQPFELGGLKTHNHIGVPPMCMYSAVDGHLNDFHVMHYGSLALKGPGLVIIEATGVVPEGRITPYCSGLWKDAQIHDLKRVADMIKAQGSVPGIQLAHAGVKASTSAPSKGDYLVPEQDGGWQVVGPTDRPFASHYGKPHAMTVAQIKHAVQAFADAAVRADKAGVELIEIHAAHG
jgi:2,4-dienoyl-CoA reductase-like NADH-dependent reductase (Old Yellow Enzyme family)